MNIILSFYRLFTLLIVQLMFFPRQVQTWCMVRSTTYTLPISKIDYSPDKRLFIAASTSGVATLYNAANHLPLSSFSKASQTPSSVKFAPNNAFFAIAYTDSTIRLYSSFQPYTQIKSFSAGLGNGQVFLDFNDNSQYLITCGTGNSQTKVWDVSNTNSPTSTATVSTTNPVSCKFNHNNFFAVGTAANGLSYYNLGASQQWNVGLNACNAIDFNPAGTKLVGSCNTGASKVAVQLTIATQATATLLNPGITMRASSFALNGATMVFGGDQKKVSLVDSSGSLIMNYTVPSNIQSSDFSDDGQYLIIGLINGQIYEFATSCLECEPGYYQNMISQTCNLCSSTLRACDICINSTVCSQCSQGYYLDAPNGNSNCLSCQIMIGCGSCQNSTKCVFCTPGFYLNNDICKACASNEPGCLRCNTSAICEQCTVDYYLSPSNKCISCKTGTACTTQSQCNKSGYCNYCSIGFYSSSVGVCSTCISAIPKCLVCKTNSICFECRQGYKPSATQSSCISCSTGCLLCEQDKASSACLSCVSSMYLKAADKMCYACSNPCLTCSGPGNTNCLSCVSGYYYNSTLSLCKTCNFPCVTCNSTSQCVSCPLGYYLSGTTCLTCQSLSPYSEQCSTTVSLNCTFGFYLDSSVPPLCKACSLIMYHCLSCTSTLNCSSCSPGTFLSTTPNSGNNSCLNCPYNCLQCSSLAVCSSCVGGYYLSISNQCIQCSNGCRVCSNATNCIQCDLHFFITSIIVGTNSCTLCGDLTNGGINGCLQCYSNSVSVRKCTECAITHYLDSNGLCVQCVDNCQICNSTYCFECKLGHYYNSGASACQKCSQNCTECSTSSSTCTSCATGFHLISGTNNCQPCSQLTNQGCLTCTSDASSLCLQCDSGYYLSTAFDTTPKQCFLCTDQIAYCLKCSRPAASILCQVCSYGYLLAVNQLSCLICSDVATGCLECSTLGLCDKCENGYYSDNSGNCIICEQSCQTCLSSTQCLTCSIGFILTVNTCQVCENSVTGCYLCQYTSPSVIDCIQCINGFYLHSGTQVCELCRSELKGCQFCNDSATCTYCYQGYYLMANNQCDQCSIPISGCEVCLTANKCVLCQSGYYLWQTSPTVSKCEKCMATMQGCLVCEDNLATLGCLSCDTGYYLNYAGSGTVYRGNCQICSNTIQGCINCNNSAQCTLCRGGYYLSVADQLCYPCLSPGCQVCLEGASSTCISCNSRYFLNNTDPLLPQCEYCKDHLVGCLQCVIQTECTKCQTGYFLDSSTNLCKLCQYQLPGCSKCDYKLNSITILQCFDCSPMHYQLVSMTDIVCQSCLEAIIGCQYCFDSNSCIGCASGYYLNQLTNLCQSCQNITGCLLCSNQTSCLLCKGNYFLQDAQFICYACSVLEGCYSCVNNITCKTCIGGYKLNDAKLCQLLTTGGASSIQGLKLITEYEDQQTLSHHLLPNQMKFNTTQITNTQLLQQVIITMQNPAYVQTQLTIKSYKWVNQVQLQFNTNNPYSAQVGVNSASSIKSIPTRRLLTPIPDGYKTYLQMDAQLINRILPDLYMPRTLTLDYKLSEPDFYRTMMKSVTSSVSMLFSIFGIATISMLTISHLVKAVKTAKYLNNSEYGQILPHLLSLKALIFILYPLYPEEIGFSFGFMVAEFPWALQYFNQLFADKSEYMPQQYSVLYQSMSLICTYLVPFIVIVLLGSIMWLYYKSPSSNKLEESDPKMPNQDMKVPLGYLNIIPDNRLKSLLNNFFMFGLTFNCSAAFQSCIYNPISTPTVSSISVIIGAILLFCIIAKNILSFYQKIENIGEVRVLIKAIMLSLCHFSPLYLFCATVITDTLLLIIQYKCLRQVLHKPYIFLVINALAICALVIEVLVSWHLASLISIMAIVFIIIILQIYQHYTAYKGSNFYDRRMAKRKLMFPTEQSLFKINAPSINKEHEQIWDLAFHDYGQEQNQCDTFIVDIASDKSRKSKYDNPQPDEVMTSKQHLSPQMTVKSSTSNRSQYNIPSSGRQKNTKTSKKTKT